MKMHNRVFLVLIGLGLLLAGIGLGQALADEIYVPLVNSGSGSGAAQVATVPPTAIPVNTATPTPTAQSVGDYAECPTADFLPVSANPANSAWPDPYLNVHCTENTVVIESNGIPSFEFVQLTPNQLQAQDYSWEIPLNPTVDETPDQIPLLGVVAIAVNGMPIYGPNEGAIWATATPIWTRFSTSATGTPGRVGTIISTPAPNVSSPISRAIPPWSWPTPWTVTRFWPRMSVRTTPAPRSKKSRAVGSASVMSQPPGTPTNMWPVLAIWTAATAQLWPTAATPTSPQTVSPISWPAITAMPPKPREVIPAAVPVALPDRTLRRVQG
ncbi:MAG: hypothetical protein WBO46_15645, partial [Caldilineaceae bacterium]